MIAVLIYIYYTEIWEELYPLLVEIKDQIHIDIALCSDNDNTKILNDLKKFKVINIRFLENRGVDVGPFMLQIKDLDGDKYPYFIKIHSKKSLIQKLQWRYVLFNALIGSKSILSNNIRMLDQNNDVGAITDPVTIMNYIGNNKKHVDLLCKMLNITSKNKYFMAGNIFMSRTKIFQKYITDKFVKTIYPLLETKKVTDIDKGTYCHGLERIFGKIISNENLKITYPKTKPWITIFNKTTNKKYYIYKCYNNYCYSRCRKTLIYGHFFPITNDDSLLIDWNYLRDYSHYFRRYDKQSNDTFIGVS